MHKSELQRYAINQKSNKCIIQKQNVKRSKTRTLLSEIGGFYAKLVDGPSPLFITHFRIYICRVLRQSFCRKFKIFCIFWNPRNPACRIYAGWYMLVRIEDRWLSDKFGHQIAPLANSCKFGHQMAPFTLVPNLATRWRHLHWLQIWPPDDTTCNGYKFAH